MIGNHWIPMHRGNIGPWTDAEVMRQWQPPIVKIVWDGSTIPYLEDIPPSAKIIWRNYPLSEEFHGGLNLGDVRSLEPTPYPYRDLSSNGYPLNGSGRDVYRAVRSAAELPTPEQAAEVYVKNAIEVAGDADSKGIALSRLLFEGPNEYPVWAHGYTGLARLERRRLELMHQRLPACGSVVSNLGVGWPGNTGPDTPPVWGWFADVAAAMGPRDYLGAHEYTGFGGVKELWGWWTGRILKCPYQVPILITECLVDGGVYGAAHAKQGYRNYPDMPSEEARVQRHVDELYEYARLIGADGRVRAILPYTYDGNRQDWSNFDIRTEIHISTFLARIAREGLPQPGAPPIVERTLTALLRAAFGTQYSDLRTVLTTHPTLEYARRPPAAIIRLALHHTVTSPQTSWETVAKYHVNSKGWPGIGYHIGIHPDGRVALLNDPEAISYHAGDASQPGDENANSLALAVMGNHETTPVSDALWSLIERVAVVVRAYLVRPVPLLGHREIAHGTLCPGKHLMARLHPVVPPADLPEHEPIMAVGTLADKARWWLEESIRQDEAGNTTRAKAIRYSLIKLDGGLFYRLERALKAGQATG